MFGIIFKKDLSLFCHLDLVTLILIQMGAAVASGVVAKEQCRNALTWVTIITLFKGSFHHFFLYVSREEKVMPDRRSDAFRLHYTLVSSEPGLPPADNPGATLGSIETQKLNDTQ
ncbi:hypothetical protein AVEN_150160-1 [Araneus ventricosus]|uniref:Uncharacterized protein n=1 Tax=Araneus ventricosus TaxID=182803 RepID=A0A4Y2SI48_ARAVE|nr:hypothetical protein AVEN_150160-1 [Araneus ventricosus]